MNLFLAGVAVLAAVALHLGELKRLASSIWRRAKAGHSATWRGRAAALLLATAASPVGAAWLPWPTAVAAAAATLLVLTHYRQLRSAVRAGGVIATRHIALVGLASVLAAAAIVGHGLDVEPSDSARKSDDVLVRVVSDRFLLTAARYILIAVGVYVLFSIIARMYRHEFLRTAAGFSADDARTLGTIADATEQRAAEAIERAEDAERRLAVTGRRLAQSRRRNLELEDRLQDSP